MFWAFFSVLFFSRSNQDLAVVLLAEASLCNPSKFGKPRRGIGIYEFSIFSHMYSLIGPQGILWEPYSFIVAKKLTILPEMDINM